MKEIKVICGLIKEDKADREIICNLSQEVDGTEVNTWLKEEGISTRGMIYTDVRNRKIYVTAEYNNRIYDIKIGISDL